MSKADSIQSWNSWKTQETLKEQPKQHLESKTAKKIEISSYSGASPSQKALSDLLYKQGKFCHSLRNVQIPFRSFLLEKEEQLSDFFCSEGTMPLGTWAKLLTQSKSQMLQNSENSALNTGLIPFIAEPPLHSRSASKEEQ